MKPPAPLHPGYNHIDFAAAAFEMPLRRGLADSGLRASRGELNPTATVHLHLFGKPSATDGEQDGG
jgi:hypothetical protein